MHDQRLIERLFARDQTALEALAERYGGYCMTVARNLLGQEADAEECLNDTWLAAWDAIPPHRPANLATFLGRLTRNLALNRLRDEAAEKRGGGEVPAVFDELAELLADRDDVESTIERRELLAAVNAWLSTQSKTRRRIFVCRYWYFDSPREIAARCGMRENTVSVTLTRMRADLRQYCKERGFEP